MNIKQAIDFLEKNISDSKVGLPEDIFLFISRLTPLVNVDLLIKDEDGRTLLSWRDDIHGVGWHVPGGIVRFKEKLENRVLKVAEREIGARVSYDRVPIAFNELMCRRDTRGHFISVLYKCFLSKDFIPKNIGLNETDAGYLKWHKKCPNNLLEVHEIYRRFM